MPSHLAITVFSAFCWVKPPLQIRHTHLDKALHPSKTETRRSAFLWVLTDKQFFNLCLAYFCLQPLPISMQGTP